VSEPLAPRRGSGAPAQPSEARPAPITQRHHLLRSPNPKKEFRCLRVLPDRMCAQIDGDFVVFIIGMRINNSGKSTNGFRC
jgi:hypothetical protein